MAEEKDEAKIIDAQFTTREQCQNATNYLGMTFDQGFVGENGSAGETGGVVDLSRKSLQSPPTDMAPVIDDLPHDMITSSPMKILDIINLLMESEKTISNGNGNEIDGERLVLDDDDEHGQALTNDTGIYENGFESIDHGSIDDGLPILRRSHSCQIDYGRNHCDGGRSNSGIIRDSVKSLSLSNRSKSLGNIDAIDHYQQQPATSSSMQQQQHSWLLPSISSFPVPTIDHLHDICEAIQQQQQQQQVHAHGSGPSVNILGYSLPLVSVEGDSAEYVCVTDVFQTFFGTRHWDEFKTILEKNGIRSVSTALASSDSAFGVAEIVDAVDVKQVETLLLSNQARKDGFVRCVRLSMDDGGGGGGEISTVGTTSSSTATSESKIIMMTERQVGELSSGIRTRHADQSDIVYVELDGQTLPSIILNGVQYVRLVDVLTNFLTTTLSTADKPQPTPSAATLTKELHLLKSACGHLKIDVAKCRPNEKARMVVYAHSCHSSSLHIIPADQLPRLIQHVRRMKKRKLVESSATTTGGKRSRSGSLVNGNGLRVSIIDEWSSDYSHSISTSTSGYSPSSGVDSYDRASNCSGGSSIVTGLLSEPVSPIDTNFRQVGTKRRATIEGRSEEPIGKRPAKSFDTPSSSIGGQMMTILSPGTIWTNGHSSKKQSDASTPVFDLGDSKVFDGEPCQSGAVGSKVFNHENRSSVQSDRNLIDFESPTEPISPDSSTKEASSLPVVVYNRRGARGPAGKYYDHLFVGKTSPCIWCFGCKSFLTLARFVTHHHQSAAAAAAVVSNPQLFSWVNDASKTNMNLWTSLLEKSKAIGLRHLVSGNDGGDDQQQMAVRGSTNRNGSSSKNGGCRRPEVVLGGQPQPPPPLSFRRRQIRGDAFIDVLERYSVEGFAPPLSVSGVVGLNSDEDERAIEASYGCN